MCRQGRPAYGIALVLGVLLGTSGSVGAGKHFFKALNIERSKSPAQVADFALPTPDGKLVRLRDLRGNVVFLNFWATWCPACREEMPSMERLHQEFKDKGLVILAVDLQETREAVGAFMREFGLTFPALLDRDGKVSDHYKVRFIPTTYLVGKQGELLGRVIGPKDWASVPARQLIASLLDPVLAATLATTEPQATPSQADKRDREFLERHWKFPIPAQGKPPGKFTPIEASLDPQSCGICHPAQYADWQTSLHARAMGPGVMGQLVDMWRADPESARDCQRCHAPLAEQIPQLPRSAGEGSVPDPAFDAKLQAKGLACGACHVRGWERFGPPKRDGSLESSVPRQQLPHNGATRTAAFLRSEFCQGCHQFPEDGFALNGKLLENTYAEWKASPYARQGVQCQDCHMPDRRHLWRGIHDPEMVKQGVTIDLKTTREGGRLQATLAITNSGVGHYFPTYLTPKVFLRMDLVDARGRQVKGSLREAVIGRDAPLDLSRELYDTRLAPKASFAMKETWKADRPGLRLRARVVVAPDHFYTKFFEATIPQAERGTAQLREALRQTRRSAFTIFSRQVPL
ncbi:MAG: redoxin domain-containing protein [Candidatus Rokubacteria bacterium]|nr:redoxin domain-containing protein [Candidatus Rokubacteria bacterium]